MDRVQADIQEIIANSELISGFKGQTLLVTGATGLVGSMLVKTILAANQKYNLDINIIGQIRNYEKAKFVYGNQYQDVHFVTSPRVECDTIIHTASPTTSKYFIEHPVETIKASVESTIEVLEVTKEKGASIVYLSSMEQYGVPYEQGQIMTEKTIGIINHLSTRASYSESKRLCECLCVSYAAEYKVDVIIARLAQIVGAGVLNTDNRMPVQFARSVVKGQDIVLHTEGKSNSNFVYLTDVITAILILMRHGKMGEVYNICNDAETRSVYDIANLVATKVSNNSIRVKIEKADNMGYAPETTMYLDSSKLRSLGWNAKVGMEEAYTRLVEYLKESYNG